jgi:hypothetical protein
MYKTHSDANTTISDSVRCLRATPASRAEGPQLVISPQPFGQRPRAPYPAGKRPYIYVYDVKPDFSTDMLQYRIERAHCNYR